MDQVRVLRIYEFTGPRDLVERQVAYSVHGEKSWGNGVTIRAATIGQYPEIIGKYASTARPPFFQRLLNRLDVMIRVMNHRWDGGAYGS